MSKLFVVEFVPFYQKQHTWSIEGERDGFSPSKYTSVSTEEVQVGTTISFRAVNTDEAITKFNNDVNTFRNMYIPEGFVVTIPQSRTFGIQSNYIDLMPKNKHSTRILEASTFLVKLHYGIKGAYISAITTEMEATMHLHRDGKSVNDISVESNVPEGSEKDTTIKSACALLFQRIDKRYMPHEEDAKAFLNEKPKREEPKEEESNPIWDVLKNIK